MFNNISWQAYWTTLALVSASYYLVLYWIYFRSDLEAYWNRQASNSSSLTNTFPGTSTTENHQQSLFEPAGDFQHPPKESEEAVVYACMDELTAFFEQSRSSKCIKQEIILLLQALLKKYPTLKTSGYKESFTNVMVTQCEHMCSIHLNADDLVKVWFGS